jgi:hypothetical protein
VGVRSDSGENESFVGFHCGTGEPQQLFNIGAGSGREQLLGLIETQDGYGRKPT